MVRRFLSDIDVFCNGSESDNSDNDCMNYNKNNGQQQFYLRFLPIIATKMNLLQEIIRYFAISKHCSRSFLFAEGVVCSHGFEKT